MDDWIDIKNLQIWLLKYPNMKVSKETNISIIKQHKWFSKNNFNFTPCVFINGYLYPKLYEISDLQFFINEIIDDKINYQRINNKAETEKL